MPGNVRSPSGRIRRALGKFHATLSLVGEDESFQEVLVESARFTIGYGGDNDLAINEPGLSRRHALIESFDGVFQLSDCGSGTGTFVNGNAVKGVVVLSDRDEIRLGSGTMVVFRIKPGSTQTEPREHRSQSNEVAQPRSVKSVSSLTLALAVAIAAAAVALLIVAFSNNENGPRVATYNLSNQADEPQNIQTPEKHSDTQAVPKIETTAKTASVELIEQSLVGFLRRISAEERSYVFPSDAVRALDDIRRRIDEYRGLPALVAAFNSINISATKIAAEARREGLEPALVIFTALTLTDGGRNGTDQTAVANRALPELMELRKTLGTESADKSLILIAAYRMGGGTKRSHPLIRTMTRVIKNPLTDRNVWYLREQGALDDLTYDFVVRFLALGAIAENPAKFGVNAPRISF